MLTSLRLGIRMVTQNPLISLTFKITFIYLLIYLSIWGPRCHGVPVWKSVLSLHMGHGDQTHVTLLGGRYLFPLSHLAQDYGPVLH